VHSSYQQVFLFELHCIYVDYDLRARFEFACFPVIVIRRF